MSLDVARTSLTVDPRGLDGLKRDVRAGDDSPETLRAVAQQFESLFAQMLIKSMRATSFGDGLMDSEQSGFYRDIFDQQMATELSEGRGLGLADLLVRQLAGAPEPGATATAAGAAPVDGTAATSSAAGASSPAPDATAATGRDSPWRPGDREDFVREVWPHAVAAGRRLGIDPATIVSHAALETGWGRSLPRQADGRTSFNLFGIKAGGGWSGASAPASTLEFRDSRLVRSVETFRAYDSLGAGLADYAGLHAGSPRYAAALGTGSDVGAFAGALQRAGYATDPHYAAKLQAVATEVRVLLQDPAGLKTPAPRPINPTTGSVAT